MGRQLGAGAQHTFSRYGRNLSRKTGVLRYRRTLDSVYSHGEFSRKLGRNHRQLSFSAFDFRLAYQWGNLCTGNVRMGRGDRRGAFQLSLFMGSMTAFLWYLWGHFVLDLQSYFLMFSRAFGESLFLAAFVWLSYMALEPYVRRYWPGLLISWARLSSGKFRDPLVGRDLLAGALAGEVLVGLAALECALPYWTNIRGTTPAPVIPQSLGDARHFAGGFIGSLQFCVLVALSVLALLFLVHVIVRKYWLAAGIAALVLAAGGLSSENMFVDLPIQCCPSRARDLRSCPYRTPCPCDRLVRILPDRIHPNHVETLALVRSTVCFRSAVHRRVGTVRVPHSSGGSACFRQSRRRRLISNLGAG